MKTLPVYLRWLAGITGCVTGIIWVFDFGLGILSLPLFLGAIGGAPGIVWFGAVLVNLSILPLSLWFLLSDGSDPWFSAASGASALLIIVCDFALLFEAIISKLGQPNVPNSR
jgi:hypothetical protein